MSNNSEEEFDILVINLKTNLNDYFRRTSASNINSCKEAFKDLQKHVKNNNKLKSIECAITLRMIFFPFAVKSIQENNKSSSFLMISMISWWLENTKWLEKKNEKTPSSILFSLLLERKIYSADKINITNSKKEKLGFSSLQSEPKSLNMLIKLFEIKDSSSTDCDNLVRLISIILKSVLDKENETAGLKYMFKDCDLRSLWKLYIDPLLINQAITLNLTRELPQHVGREKFMPTDAAPIIVKWTDNRTDRYIEEKGREKVDYIIEFCLENFEWEERQKIVDSIKWEEIKFRNESVENDKFENIICQKFLNVISFYFKKFDEKTESITLNFKKFLESLASYGSILMKNANFFKNFINIIFENPEKKLIENSEEFIQRFIKNLNEKNDSDLAKQNRIEFEKYLKELYDENALVTLSSIDLNGLLFKILDEITPNSLKNVSIRWLLNLMKCLQYQQIELNKYCFKVKKILKIIQENASFSILKYFTAELFSIGSPNMHMIISLIKVFDNDRSIHLYLKEIKSHEIKCFKAAFINLKTFQDAPVGYIDAMSFMCKLAFKITQKCGDYELEVMQNDDFIDQLVDIFAEFKEDYSNNLLFSILRLAIRSKNYDKGIANKISDYLPIFLNNGLNTDELKILVEYFHEIDKKITNNSEKCIDSFLSILINKIQNCDQTSKSQLEYTMNGVEKCLNGSIFMDELIKKNFKDAIDKFKVEFLSLIKFPFFQEVVIKILFAVINLEVPEREILLEKFSIRKINAKRHEKIINKQDMSDNNLLLFNTQSSDDSKIDNKPVTEQEFNHTLTELEALADRKKKNIVFDSDLIQEQIQKNNKDKFLTNNMKDNIFKIIDTINDGIPLLLEGPTGVGKSASITKAAFITENDKNFIRFNMSSRITIEDLMGKLIIQKKDGVEDFIFDPRPFYIAFKNGYWLLLDELNLAQDVVLQSIENALDSNFLNIFDPTNAIEPRIIIQKHPKFRLFATQNPCSGFFKGKREKLSASFLDRFRIVVFEQLSRDDFIMIANSYFSSTEKTLIETLIDKIHIKISQTCSESFVEWEPYSEITVRDLLKFIELIKKSIDTELKNLHKIPLFYDIAKCVYSARFRRDGKNCIEEIIKLSESSEVNDAPEKETCDWSINDEEMKLNDVVCKREKNKHFKSDLYYKTEWEYRFDKKNFDINFIKNFIEIHTDIEYLCIEKSFIANYGLYMINNEWLWDWINKCNEIEKNLGLSLSVDECFKFGCLLYSRKFRKKESQMKVENIFKKRKNENDETKLIFDISDERQIIKIETNERSVEIGFSTEKPFVVTQRVLKLWKNIAILLNSRSPILVTGNEGNGKSLSISVFTYLIGINLTQISLTPESEPSILVGQFLPNTNKNNENLKLKDENTIKWKNGYVTDAFENNEWILIDNLNQAESSILERLNPVLENPPVWSVTEKGDNTLKTSSNFRIFATMNPPIKNRPGQLSFPELSPALYNRFSILHMDDFMDVNSQVEFEKIIKTLVNIMEPQIQSIIQLILFLVKKQSFLKIENLSCRNIIRMVECIEVLQIKYQQLQFEDIFWAAYKLTFEKQIKNHEIIDKELMKEIENIIKPKSKNLKLTKLCTDNGFILTDSREDIANSIKIGLSCGWALLLEGPAAVGKTELISRIGKNEGKILERVNNNSNTTTNDYFGSYIPKKGKEFEYQDGPLVKAMKEGWWFLADEFNLAEPAVLNSLFPLLEGHKKIALPGTDLNIIVHENFRFIATQNDSKYAGRNQLSLSLQNRFITIQFNDYSSAELMDIISKRIDNGILLEEQIKLANLYIKLKSTNYRITMREIVKCLKRQQKNKDNKYKFSDILISVLGSCYNEQLQNFMEKFNEVWFPDDLKTQIPPKSTDDAKSDIKTSNEGITFSEGKLQVLFKDIHVESSIIDNLDKYPNKIRKLLSRLALAIHNREPVLLIGPTSFKSFLIQRWVQIFSRENDLAIVNLTPESDAAELIGQTFPYTMIDMFDLIIKYAKNFEIRYTCLIQQIQDINKNFYIIGDIKIKIKELSDEYDLITNIIKNANKNINTASDKDRESLDSSDELEEEDENLKKLRENLVLTETENNIENAVKNDNVDPFDYGRKKTASDKNEPNIDGESSDSIDKLEDDSYVDPYYKIYKDSQKDDIQSNSGSSEASFKFDDDPDEKRETNEIILNETTGKLISNSTTSSDEVDYYLDKYFNKKPSQGSSENDRSAEEDNDVTKEIDESMEPQVPVLKEEIEDDDYIFFQKDEELKSSNSNKSDQNKENNNQEFPMTNSTEIYDNYIKKVYELLRMFKTINDNNDDSVLMNHTAVIGECLNNILKLKENNNISDPIFLFKDGPVTKAVKNSNLLILEDFDLPSQAVTERLNSLLENEPSFNLTENLHINTTSIIKILDKFSIIATVHQDNEFQSINLSPAALSRFTQLRVEAYNENEIQVMIENEVSFRIVKVKPEMIKDWDIKDPKVISDYIVRLRKIINNKIDLKNDIQQLFRWIDFVFKIKISVFKQEVEKEIIKIFLGAKFSYLEKTSESDQHEISKSWLNSINKNYIELGGLIKDPGVNEDALDTENNEKSVSPFNVLQNSEDPDDKTKFISLEMKYTGIIIQTKQKDEKKNEIIDLFAYCNIC